MLFDLADQPRDINGGADSLTYTQMFPQTSAIGGTRPGVSGASTGVTTFQHQDSSRWWVPSQSYYVIRGHFLDGAGNALARDSGISYCDNWVSALFSQIQYFVDSKSVELLQNLPVADTAMLYSTADRSYLKSFASASGVGESLVTRQLNSAQFGTAAVSPTNYNEVVATWRPACSLFDTPGALPPGGLWRCDFSWAANGEQEMIQSTLGPAIAGVDFVFVLDEFTMYCCTVMPDPEILLPESGIVELSPYASNIYMLTGGNTLQANIPLQASTNRILICFQDNNVVNNLAAGQNGLKPVTQFTAAMSNGGADFSSYIQTMYISLPALGVQQPNPSYGLSAGDAAGAKSGWSRAYADWVNCCRGSSGGYEGSIPFGAYDSGIGAAVLEPLALTPVMQVGDPSNSGQAWLVSATGGAGAGATAANQTARHGWLGSPIFGFPIVRPPGVGVNTANLNVTFSGNVTSGLIHVISLYSMALVVTRQQNGQYKYDIVRDVL